MRDEVASATTTAGNRRVLIVAVAYGALCHLAFATAVVSMMVVLFSGMTDAAVAGCGASRHSASAVR